MQKLRAALVSLLQSDQNVIDVHDLRLAVIETDPLKVTEDNESYFELAEIQPFVSDQARNFPYGQGLSVYVISGQLVYKKIPHMNQWFWDLHVDPSMLRCEQSFQQFFRPDIRPVSENYLVQKAQADRSARESMRSYPSTRAPGYSPNKYYSPERPLQAPYYPQRATNLSPQRYQPQASFHTNTSYAPQAAGHGLGSQAAPLSSSSLGFPSAAGGQGFPAQAGSSSLYPAAAKRVPTQQGASSGRRSSGGSYRQRDNRMLEDLKAAVKAGMIKWDDIIFTQETIKYAKDNFARLVSELDAQQQTLKRISRINC